MKKLALIICLLTSSLAFSEDIYRLEAKIGEHTFADVFTFDGCSAEKLKGSLTVPGVFTSKLEDVRCIKKAEGDAVTFRILVRENNQEYYVSYNLLIAGEFISGTMMSDEVVIGTINGQLIFRGK